MTPKDQPHEWTASVLPQVNYSWSDSIRYLQGIQKITVTYDLKFQRGFNSLVQLYPRYDGLGS
ncbi:MAG: hypothetical protein ACKVLN_11205, partial [Rhodobacterales bacterium]